MKINFNLNLGTLILTALLVLVALGWRSERNESNRWEGNYHASQEELHNYTITNSDILASYVESIQLTKAELRDALESDSIQRELARRYKELSEMVKVVTVYKTKWDTLRIPVPIFIDRDTTITHKDDCISLDMGFSNGSFAISGIEIPNTIRMAVGERKNGLFKGTTYSVDIAHSNPCVLTTGMTSYKIVHQRKWWENPLITIPIGVGFGYIITR